MRRSFYSAFSCRFHRPISIKPRHILITFALVVLFLIFLTSTYPHQPSSLTAKSSSVPPPTTLPELQLLNLTQSNNSANTLTAERYCDDRFGPSYLYDLRHNSFQYCSPKPHNDARLTCFHTRRRTPTQLDSFCIAQGALLSASKRKFTLDCSIRRPSKQETREGLVRFDAIRGYWYETGPRYIFYKFFTKFKVADDWSSFSPRSLLPSLFRSKTQPIYTILIKREGSQNLFHSLMEIWSLTQSLDVLRLTTDPQTGSAYFDTPTNAQVVILDDHPDGPYLDLWTMMAVRPPVRLEQALKSRKGTMLAASPGIKHNVIIPLAGAANAIWDNDWEDRNCEHAAPLLKLFVRRVLNHVGVRPFEAPAEGVPAQTKKKKIRVTYILRTESRRLLHFDALLASARLAFGPDVDPRVVDFASLSFAEQVYIVHYETDVLVGVHGAGLTHTMFLHGDGGGKAMVEIQPDVMHYKGFRNLARMLGCGYFMEKGHSEDAIKEERSGERVERTDLDSTSTESQAQDEHLRRRRFDWHLLDVSIGEKEFLDVVGEAVGYVRGWRERTP
ncbi:hypothetical protein BDV98DRAFT_325347 [Pterulicium gracile]|uniref:EGF domain-specific O-linked N-acetylglucosamine transferase n=1 Tax=Pterulicium gracile TaxID=1884261 RepID=A0A5C3QRM4_9AGAR|nr:hypothetical protein BDV98DRAFT_325347 [Pterula gracilis]